MQFRRQRVFTIISLPNQIRRRKFAAEIDKDKNVAVYVKLPGGFYIDTPVGKYNPDWAIAFYEGSVKHIYFVAETKGDLSTLPASPDRITQDPVCTGAFQKDQL